MKKVLIILPLFLALTAGAADPQSRDDICSVADPALVSSKDIPLVPEYFFRPFPNSNSVAVASGNQNYFYNLDTGVATQIPGSYDALPLPGEKLWIYPGNGGSGLHFRKIKDGVDAGSEIFSDDNMQGYYQSAGKVASPTGGDRYRVIIDTSGGSGTVGFLFQDYDASADNIITPVNPNPKRLCGNLTGSHSLPMLSKDGGRIALLDISAGFTKIYTIDAATGNCTLERSLFQSTGKVDFSFDNKTITYHAINRMSSDDHAADGHWFKTPTGQMVANVWTTDLNTGLTKQISHFTESSALYPAFNSKGEILVRKFKADGGSTILTYDPSKEKRSIDPVNFGASSAACTPQDIKAVSLTVLGQLFADLCMDQNAKFPLQSKALFAMNLDKNSCHRLAQSFEANKGKVTEELKASDSNGALNVTALSKVNLKALLSACPQEVLSGPRNQIKMNKPKVKVDLTKIPAPLARCLTCHGKDSALPMPFDDVDGLKAQLQKHSKVHPGVMLLDEMRARVDGRSVPPANNLGAKALTDDETDEVMSWLTAQKKPH